MNSENIIQFMHPGGYDRREGEISWNRGKHKRKLIKNKILFLEDDGKSKNESGYFWGEWESYSIASCENFNGNKYYAHTLLLHSSDNDKTDVTSENCNGGCKSADNGLLNTDPYVFGNHFYYSNCMQSRYPILKNLHENDIIIFGSRVNGEFVLDTVFVVECKIKNAKCSDCFKTVTVNLLDKESNNKIYKSKMYNEKAKKDEIYSFFPCSDKPFDRPILALEGITKQKRGVHYIKEKTSKEIWNDIVAAVKSNGLKIGVWAKEPEER